MGFVSWKIKWLSYQVEDYFADDDSNEDQNENRNCFLGAADDDDKANDYDYKAKDYDYKAKNFDYKALPNNLCALLSLTSIVIKILLSLCIRLA